MHIIKDIEELKALADNIEGIDCFIMLNFCLRSSKHVSYDDSTDLWSVYNEVDDTFVECTTEELATQTNILEALSKNALVLDE